ncbi:hypothetical protein Tco_0851297 [Tanacetum coccineum]
MSGFLLTIQGRVLPVFDDLKPLASIHVDNRRGWTHVLGTVLLVTKIRTVKIWRTTSPFGTRFIKSINIAGALSVQMAGLWDSKVALSGSNARSSVYLSSRDSQTDDILSEDQSSRNIAHLVIGQTVLNSWGEDQCDKLSIARVKILTDRSRNTSGKSRDNAYVVHAFFLSALIMTSNEDNFSASRLEIHEICHSAEEYGTYLIITIDESSVEVITAPFEANLYNPSHVIIFGISGSSVRGHAGAAASICTDNFLSPVLLLVMIVGVIVAVVVVVVVMVIVIVVSLVVFHYPFWLSPILQALLNAFARPVQGHVDCIM